MVYFPYWWRDGEAVTQESAKLPCAGSIPARASLWKKKKVKANPKTKQDLARNKLTQMLREGFLERAIQKKHSTLKKTIRAT